jgi:uncharacterized membrane protein YfhO
MVGLLAAVAVMVFHDYLFFKKAYLFKDIGSDSVNIAYPSIVHVLDYVRAEGIPMWSFNQGMGQNIFAATGDIFLPIFYLFGRDNVGFSFAYVEVLKILVGGFFFYLYLKMLDLTPLASIVGGVLFAFSGYMILGGGWYMFSYDAMCGAMLLFGFENLFQKNILWILPIPFALLAAYQPFYLYLYGLLIFVYFTMRYLEAQRWNFRAYAGLLFKIVTLALLGAAISSVFLFEGIAQLLQSPRGGGDASYFKTMMSKPMFTLGSPTELSSVVLRLFSSDLQGTGDDFRGWMNYLESPLLYCGVITLLAAPQFLVSLDSRKRKIYAAIVGACVIALMFPYFRHAFWGFTGDYYRTFSFFISLLFVYLGVRGLSYVDQTSHVRPVTLMASLGFILALLYLPPYEKYTRVDGELRGVIALFLFGYAAVIGLLGTAKYRRLGQVLTVGAVCFEAAFLSHITVNHRVVVEAKELSQRVGYNDYTVDAVKHIKSIDSGFYRVHKEYSSGPAIHHPSINDAKIQQFYGSSSYSGFNQMYYVKFLEGLGVVDEGNETATRWAIGLRNRPVLQILCSVKYAFTKDAVPYPDFLWDPIKTVGDVHVARNKLFLPLGVGYDAFVLKSDFLKLDVGSRDLLLTKAFVIDDSEQDKYKGFVHLNPASVPPIRTVADLEQGITLLGGATMHMTEHRQSLIRGTIALKAKKLLFLSVPYDKGWVATVDGKLADIKLVDFGLMGIVLEAGEHTIELKFRPRFLVAGATVSLASLAGFVVLFFVSGRPRRRSVPPGTSGGQDGEPSYQEKVIEARIPTVRD